MTGERAQVIHKVELDLLQLEMMQSTELARLLTHGHVVEYDGKTLYPYECDFGAFVICGSDAYGADFIAGDLRNPDGIKSRL